MDLNKIEKNLNPKSNVNNSESDLNENKTQESIQGINIIKSKLKETNRVNIILFFISELGFIFILGFVLLLLYIIPQYHSAKVFTSKNQIQEFNKEYTPQIFIHITDIHITLNKPKKLDGSSIFLTSLYEYKPDFF